MDPYSYEPSGGMTDDYAPPNYDQLAGTAPVDYSNTDQLEQGGAVNPTAPPPDDMKPSDIAPQPTQPTGMVVQQGLQGVPTGLEEGYLTQDQLFRWYDIGTIGEIRVKVLALHIGNQKNVYCNIRTRVEKGRIITKKLKSEIRPILGDGEGYPEVFGLEFRNASDQLWIHNWKKKMLGNKNVGQLTCSMRELIGQDTLSTECRRTFEMRPKGTIDLSVGVNFKPFHRIASFMIPANRMKEGYNCLVIANMTLHFEDITAWGQEDFYSTELGTKCLAEMFLSGNTLHSAVQLAQLKDRAMDFPTDLQALCFDKYGVRVMRYRIAMVVNKMPSQEKLDILKNTLVSGMCPARGGFCMAGSAYDLYMDAIRSYPELCVTCTIGYISMSYISRDVILKDYIISVSKGEGVIRLMLPDKLTSIMGCEPPQVL